jgi:hypothetical protein
MDDPKLMIGAPEQGKNGSIIFEDMVLGYLAKERYDASDEDDYYTSEEIEKKLKLI